MGQIKLMSSDGQAFDVDLAVVKKSQTIKTMLEDLGLEEGDGEPVPLPNVRSAILRKVIEWSEHHKDDAPVVDDDEDSRHSPNTEVPEWDQAFFKVELGMVFDLILAANYMDIKGLLDSGCKTVANMIKGKTPEEIRKTFNIKNDFEEGEEDNVRELRKN